MSKILDNVVELSKIQYISGNNSLNFTATPINDGSPIVDATAGLYANGAFVQSNASFTIANSAALYANGAFVQSNAAFIKANTPDHIANSAALYANGAFAQANAAFESANNVAPQIQPAFSTANSAGLYANASFIQANAAFNAANTISLNKIYTNDTSVESVDANSTNSRIIITVDANTVTEVSSSNLKINLSTVATSTTTGALQVLGGAGITGNLHVGGTIYAAGDVVSSYSDERLKDKTRDVTEALSIISKLNAFYYTANDTARKYTRTDGEEKIGLSAQDVQRVLPSVVSLSAFDTELDDNGNIKSKTGENYLTVDYARIVPILIQAIKEQQKEIDLLKEKIDGIYNR